MKLISLSVTVDTPGEFETDQVLAELSTLARDLVKDGHDVSVSTHKIRDDSSDEVQADDDKRLLTWKVHEILTRLGASETEAWTAITEIHEAGIIFAKKDV